MKDAKSIRFKTTAKLLLACGLVGSLALAGCAKKDDPAPTPPAGGPTGGPGGAPQNVAALLPGGEEFAAAKKLYAANDCAKCHKLGATGGGPGGPGMPPGPPPGAPPKGPPGGMGRGPDLTHVGASAEHTEQWLADHIRDAKSHKPMSRMPPFGPDKINDADLMTLAEYLASQK